MTTTPRTSDDTSHHHLERSVLTRTTKYTRETDRSSLALLCARGVVRTRRSSLARVPRSVFPADSPFLFLYLFSFFFHSQYSPTVQNTRTDGTDARREMRDYEKPGTEPKRQPLLAFSVLLSVRRCTLPGGKTPTRSRAHPSSTLARLYTQGVYTLPP